MEGDGAEGKFSESGTVWVSPRNLKNLALFVLSKADEIEGTPHSLCDGTEKILDSCSWL